jgi:hypothetical protein
VLTSTNLRVGARCAQGPRAHFVVRTTCLILDRSSARCGVLSVTALRTRAFSAEETRPLRLEVCCYYSGTVRRFAGTPCVPIERSRSE